MSQDKKENELASSNQENELISENELVDSEDLKEVNEDKIEKESKKILKESGEVKEVKKADVKKTSESKAKKVESENIGSFVELFKRKDIILYIVLALIVIGSFWAGIIYKNNKQNLAYQEYVKQQQNLELQNKPIIDNKVVEKANDEMVLTPVKENDVVKAPTINVVNNNDEVKTNDQNQLKQAISTTPIAVNKTQLTDLEKIELERKQYEEQLKALEAQRAKIEEQIRQEQIRKGEESKKQYLADKKAQIAQLEKMREMEMLSQQAKERDLNLKLSEKQKWLEDELKEQERIKQELIKRENELKEHMSKTLKDLDAERNQVFVVDKKESDEKIKNLQKQIEESINQLKIDEAKPAIDFLNLSSTQKVEPFSLNDNVKKTSNEEKEVDIIRSPLAKPLKIEDAVANKKPIEDNSKKEEKVVVRKDKIGNNNRKEIQQQWIKNAVKNANGETLQYGNWQDIHLKKLNN